MAYFDETLKDWVRTQQAGLGSFGSAYAQMKKRNNKIIEILGGEVSSKNYRQVIAKIKKLNIETREKVLRLIERQLAEVATITYRNEAGNIGYLGVSVASVSTKMINPIRAVNAALDHPMHNINRTVREIMRDTFGSSNTAATNIVARSISEGMTFSQLRKALIERFAVDDRHLSTATATAMNSVANEARLVFYQDNDDIIDRVMMRATLDSKTSDYCMHVDGKIYRVDEAFAKPPFHPNCRTFMTPVLKGISNQQARTMMRPSVADGEAKRTKAPTYGDWLKNQSAAFQKQVLGKRRYEMLRDGEISFEKFFTSDGRMLTISELEDKY